MKKNFRFALVGAIALTGAVGISSCSSSDDVSDVNPAFNGEAVKTQFTISFPSNVAGTRQSAATVQENQNIASFRGMDNIVLLPFGVAGAVDTDPITSDHKKLGAAIDLKNIIDPTTTTVTNEIPASTLKSGSNSVLYNDVTLPVGTSSFLFYGKAKDADGGNFVNGSLAKTGDEPSAIKFDLDPTYTATTPSPVGAALAAYLTQIAQAGGMTGTSSAWETTTNTGLKDLYDKFVSLKTGSSLTAQAAVQDLYSTIKNNTDDVSKAIKTAITAGTYVSSISTDGILTFTAAIGNSEATYFPGDVNLPDGAALLEYTEATNTFTQKTDGTGNTGAITAKYADYVYPASLYYYCNSGIKTSNSSQKNLYNGTNTWSQITGNAAFNGTSVSTSTRSVAILDQIQYAVGSLDATVQLEDGTTLYDKNGEAYTVDATNGFTVTGILIGGQKQVKYDFTQNTTATEFTIYDNITKSNGTITAKGTAASAYNYTLALETNKDQAVYVAVELLNNGKDFQGLDGVVPAGCKFYLIAQLTPSAGTGYDATTMNQVFRQDYKTIVNFKIPKGYLKTDTADGHFNPATGNTQGLGKAYNTIPDLRTPQLELGLSVDLTWKAGLNFGDVILGQ